MRKTLVFLAKAFVALCLVLAFLFFVIMPQYEMGFNASLLDKHARLLSVEGPRLVLIGNSNLVFGVDSEAVEEALGMPVVNMGLHGGAGNAFHEQMAKLDVRPGDIYVVCHTEYDDADIIGDPSLAWITLENHFPLYRLLRMQDIPTMADAFTTYVRKCVDLWTSGEGNLSTGDMYARDAFNSHGDNMYARERTVEGLRFEEQSVPEVGEACVRRLNALGQYLKDRGATLLLAAYPIAGGEFTPLISEYEAFQETLEAALDFPVISYFPEYMLDYSYFYDTIYHLTNEGAALRTDLLIEDLRLWREGAGA